MEVSYNQGCHYGVPIIRISTYILGSILGSPILGNYQVREPYFAVVFLCSAMCVLSGFG